MKTLIAAALMILSVQAFAQVTLPKNDEGKVVFSEVVQTPGSGSDTLHANAVRWFTETYKSEKNRKVGLDNILDIQNLKSDNYNGGVNYTIEVFVRDGRYKVMVSELRHKDYDGKRCSGGLLDKDTPSCTRGTMSKKQWDKIKADTDQQINKIMAELKTEMLKKPKGGETDDDW